MAKPKVEDSGQIVVHRIESGFIPLVLVGKSPLIINKLSEKAKHELLYPGPRKNAADKQANLKHDPVAEFRASIHRIADANAPTLLAMPSSAPKRAMASAALDIPGARKAQIGRLTYITGELSGVFGIPKLFIAPVRSSDMNRTPDIRTRCIVSEWAMPITVKFVSPMLTPTTIVNLLLAAGEFIGLGDYRNEKGAGSYGQFDVMTPEVAATDPRVSQILKMGRALQEEAMVEASPYDDESRELLTWFQQTLQVRGRKLVNA